MDSVDEPAGPRRGLEVRLCVLWAGAIRLAALAVGVAVVLAALLLPP